jgi:hypothetical protein
MTVFTLTDLEIIGFACTLEAPALPRLLAPVFRNRVSPEVVLLPPFTLQNNEIWNLTQTNPAEFDALVAQRKLTPLSAPIPAKVNHDLWVNPEGSVAYESKAYVKRAFTRLFEKHLALAEQKLIAKDYEVARHHADIARAVNPSRVDPLVIRAAAERSLGQHSRFAFTRHIAEDIVTPDDFDRLIQSRMGDETVADSHGSAVMGGSAIRRSSRFAIAA